MTSQIPVAPGRGRAILAAAGRSFGFEEGRPCLNRSGQMLGRKAALPLSGHMRQVGRQPSPLLKPILRWFFLLSICSL